MMSHWVLTIAFHLLWWPFFFFNFTSTTAWPTTVMGILTWVLQWRQCNSTPNVHVCTYFSTFCSTLHFARYYS